MKPADPAPVAHRCIVCGDHATFGIGASELRNRPGRWFCWTCLPEEHRPGATRP